MVGNHAFERINDVFTPLSVCQELYRHASVLPANETFDIDPRVETGTTSFVIIQRYNPLYVVRMTELIQVLCIMF